MNDFQTVSTTDVPVETKVSGEKIEEKKIETKPEAEESGASAEIEAQDAVETEDIEAEADDKDVDAGDDDQKEIKPKKKGGFQKKLEKQAREIEQLREQIARQQQSAPVEKPVEKSVSSDDPEPDVEKYDSLTDFYKDHSRWAARQEVKEFQKKQETKSQQERQQSELQKRVSEFQSKGAEFAKSVDDYQDVIDDVSDVIVTPGLQEALLDSENGHEILYHLAKNKDELLRINKLSLVAQAREIGKWEAKISKEEKPEIKTKTAAPPPPKPVGTKSPGKVVKDPSAMSPDEYLAWRRGKK